MDGVSTPFEARHRALVEALPDLVIRLAADGTYLEIGGNLSLLANPPEIVVGSNVRELLPAPVAENLMAGIARVLESGVLRTVEYRLRTHLGEERDFELRIAPSGPAEVLLVVRDVTSLHDAMRELQQSRARIVSSGDAERRRIERNLHDAAQSELALALEEIRELVRGLHPRLLSEQGLAPAVRALVERSPAPIELEELTEERLGPATEAAAY